MTLSLDEATSEKVLKGFEAGGFDVGLAVEIVVDAEAERGIESLPPAHEDVMQKSIVQVSFAMIEIISIELLIKPGKPSLRASELGRDTGAR